MMREELNSNELEHVTGGTVVVTSTGKVGFTTLGQMFKLQNVEWREARNYAEDLLALHPQMTDREFDEYVMAKFHDRGWI